MCTATTLAERETLDSYGTGVATDWFPNGVDTEYFAPRGEGYDHDEIVFLGRMDYYPNQECMIRFCTDVLPALQAKRPQLRLTIVGADPSPAIRRLAGFRGVSVTGRVPDVRPYLERAALMVAPLNIARGTQNKILEAMAAGVPVVASIIAARGVDAVAPDHLLTAATPEEYVDAILSIVGDASQRARLAHAGRERMLSHHAWLQSMRRLDRIVERCVQQTAPTRELAVTSP
jgi:sugar transferase (PEP-CTERM/EpsH1 system associated)